MTEDRVAPRTASGRLFLEILNVQARHVHLPPELTQDFPGRVLAIEAEAASLDSDELRKAVYGALKDTRCNVDWPEAGELTTTIRALLSTGDKAEAPFLINQKSDLVFDELHKWPANWRDMTPEQWDRLSAGDNAEAPA